MSKQLLYSQALDNFDRHDKLLDIAVNFSTIQKIAFESYDKGLSLGEVRSGADLEVMKKFVYADQIKDDSMVLSSRAEMYRLSVLLAYFYMTKDKKKMLQYSEKLSSHYINNPSLIEYSTMGYIFSLSSHVRALIQNDRTENAWELIGLLENIDKELNINNSINIQARAFIYSMNLRIEVYLLKNSFDLCLKWINKNKNELIKFEAFK